MVDENRRQRWEKFLDDYNYAFIDNDNIWCKQSINNDKKWYKKINDVKIWLNDYDARPQAKSDDATERKIGKWIEHQQCDYKNNKMTDKNRRKEWENLVTNYSHLFDITCVEKKKKTIKVVKNKQ